MSTRAVADLLGYTLDGRPVLRIRSADRPPYTCATLPAEYWEALRFPARCFFYPGRDCPRWETGQQCGRIGNVIPES